MTLRCSISSSLAVLLLTVGPCLAGPCTKEIGETEAAFDAKLNAAAAAGPTAVESTGATLHHQPTVGSIARAEAQLGDISPENAETVTAAIGRAHAADDAGNLKACEQALAEAYAALRK